MIKGLYLLTILTAAFNHQWESRCGLWPRYIETASAGVPYSDDDLDDEYWNDTAPIETETLDSEGNDS